MQEQSHRAYGQATITLLQAIGFPTCAYDGFRKGASALLVHERNAVGEAEHIYLLFFRLFSAISYTYFNLKRISSIHKSRSAYGTIKFSINFFLQTSF